MKFVFEFALYFLTPLALVWWSSYWYLKKRHFFDRVTFTLIHEDGREVKQTTLLDKRLSEIWVDNKVFQWKIKRLAKKASFGRPWLEGEDRTFFLDLYSGIIHQISQQFAFSSLEYSYSKPREERKLNLLLCVEFGPGEKVRKLRVLVFSEEFRIDAMNPPYDCDDWKKIIRNYPGHVVGGGAPEFFSVRVYV